jgi:hypothetical protein
MTEPAEAPIAPPYEDVPSASVVYFDGVAANGIMNGAIQIELAQRILVPVASTGVVNVKFATSGRLRCSPAAAQALISALQNSLLMLEQPQQPAAAASKLN